MKSIKSSRKAYSSFLRLSIAAAALATAFAAPAEAAKKFLSDGAFPQASLTFDNAGNLYGATTRGGANNNGAVYKLTPINGGYGVTYKLTPPGSSNCAANSNSWCETVLHAFTGGSDGADPYVGAPIVDVNGAVYGATLEGGASWEGLAYKLTPPASGQTQWAETALLTFSGGSDGGYPYSGLVFDTQGNLYGSTEIGGSSGCGTLFKLAPPPRADRAPEARRSSTPSRAEPMASIL